MGNSRPQLTSLSTTSCFLQSLVPDDGSEIQHLHQLRRYIYIYLFFIFIFIIKLYIYIRIYIYIDPMIYRVSYIPAGECEISAIGFRY